MSKSKSYNPRLNNNNLGKQVNSELPKEAETVQPPQVEDIQLDLMPVEDLTVSKKFEGESPELLEDTNSTNNDLIEENQQVIYVNEEFANELEEAYKNDSTETLQVDEWLQEVIGNEEQLTKPIVTTSEVEKVYEVGKNLPIEEIPIKETTQPKVVQSDEQITLKPHYEFRQNSDTLKVERVINIRSEGEAIMANNKNKNKKDVITEILTGAEEQIVKLEAEIENQKKILAQETNESKVHAIQTRIKIFESSLAELKKVTETTKPLE